MTLGHPDGQRDSRAMCGPIIGPPLAALGADQFGDLSLHDLARASVTDSPITSAWSPREHVLDDLLDRHRS